MPICPASIKANLSNGVLDVDPLDVEVSEGRLQVTPQILFDRPNPLLVAKAGPLLTHVRLAPEMCGRWLKYVMPMMSDVTQAEGTLSLNLADTAAIPWQDPLGGEVHGELLIDSAQGPDRWPNRFSTGTEPQVADRSSAVRRCADDRLQLQVPKQRVPFPGRPTRLPRANALVATSPCERRVPWESIRRWT
jgi:hypothetical protein